MKDADNVGDCERTEELRQDRTGVFSSIFDLTNTAFAILDRDCKFARINEAFARLCEVSSADLLDRPFADVFPDEKSALRGLADAVRLKQALVLNWRPQRALNAVEQTQYYWKLSITPILDQAEALEFLFLEVADLTELTTANTKLRSNETVYQSVFNAMTEGVVFHDANGSIQAVNPAAERMGGRPAAEIVNRETDPDLRETVDENGHRLAADQLPTMVALRTGEAQSDVVMGIRQWSMGRRMWISVNAQPVIVPGEASPRGVVTTFHDISERRAAEQLKTHMLHELSHRVKNTLAAVQSIALQTLSAAADPATFKAVFYARLGALARSHDLLSRDDWLGARVDELVREQLDPHQLLAGERFALAGPTVRAPPKVAIVLGMVLGELTTNAAKYGALSVDGGTVSVEWEYEAGEQPPRFRLAWREQGGPEVRQPTKPGFGMRLIQRGLISELGGSAHLMFDPRGIVCEIDLPMVATEEPGALIPTPPPYSPS